MAGHLGMTVAQLKSSLDDEELAYWIAYDRLDPIGGYRLDANFAQLARLQVGDKNSKLSEFLLFDPNPVTEEETERLQDESDRQSAKHKGEKLKSQIAKMLENQAKNQR